MSGGVASIVTLNSQSSDALRFGESEPSVQLTVQFFMPSVSPVISVKLFGILSVIVVFVALNVLLT